MYRYIIKLDWVLIASVLLLAVSGLIAIYSLSVGGGVGGFNFYNKQIIFLTLAIAILFLVSFVNYTVWRNYAGIFYLGSILLLILVFVIGKTTNGAVSWFNLGFFSVQPVELVKVSVIFVFARYFSQIKTDKIGWGHILVSLVYVLIPVCLVALQPDMGSAMVLMAIWVGMVFLAGMRLSQVIVLFIAGVVVVSMSWFFVLHNYQKQRVLTFLNPAQDALGSGYNVIQATIAIGSGGFSGAGIGKGSQSQLNFIPERHTDFIFATISEEGGLIGSSLVLFFFGLIFFRMRGIASNANDKFGRLVVGGVAVMLFFHIWVNIGMNVGLVPVAGLSLPFLSYGGSFLIIVMFLMGVVQNVWVNKRGM